MLRLASPPVLAVLVLVLLISLGRASASVPPSSSDGPSSSGPSSARPPDEKQCLQSDDDRDDDGGDGRSRDPSLIPEPIARARDLTVEEFRATYSPPDRTVPVVFENLARGDVDPADWTRDALRERCGDVPLLLMTAGGKFIEGCDAAGVDGGAALRSEDCHHVRYADPKLVGRAWAGLKAADLGAWNVSTLGDLMDRQDGKGVDEGEEEGEGEGAGGGRERRDGRGLYLHDAPLIHYCPPLMDALPGVPKYFRRDYDILTDHPSLMSIDDWDFYRDMIHFPSLFIGKAGTGSHLHADVGLTRFWILQLSGRKLWRVAPPRDRGRLYPVKPAAKPGAHKSTLYRADILTPDFDRFPKLDGLTVYETITEPGDVLYLPEGWPHQVLNLDDTVAVAYNFIDNGNLEAASAVHRRNIQGSGLDEDADYHAGLWAGFFIPLNDPPPPEGGGNFVSLRTFFGDHHLELIEDVPAAARRFVEERTRERKDGEGDDGGVGTAAAAVGSHRDRYGRPPLHVAAAYTFVSVLKYLLDDVGLDPNLEDDDGWTALDVLEEVTGGGDGPAAELLRSRGGKRNKSPSARRRGGDENGGAGGRGYGAGTGIGEKGEGAEEEGDGVVKGE